MWWCCNVPLTHVMPLQSTSTYVQWIPTVENVLESLLWGFTPVTLLAKHSTTSTSRAWCHDSTFGVRINSGDRCLAHQGAREVTNSVRDLPRPTRGWESVSSNLAGPKRRITTSASLPSKRSSAPHTGFARKKSFKSQILDLSSCTVQEYIYVGGIDPLVAAIACESSFSTAILTHGLLLFSRVPILSKVQKVVQGPKKSGGTSKIWRKRGYFVVDLGTNIHTTVN